MKPSAVLLLLLCFAGCSFSASLSTTNATNETSSPPPPASVSAPSPTPTTALPAEVAVHILERFTPYHAWTAVGRFADVAVENDYRLMASFKAYAFQPALVATMDCIFIAKNNQWMPMTTDVENAQSHTDKPAFCTRRDLTDDNSTFAVAQFHQYHNDGSRKLGMRIFAEPMAAATLLEHARSRGWRDPPLASVRVTKVKHWRLAPTLTFALKPYAMAVDNKEQAVEQCAKVPVGAVDRRVEGGDYYAGVEGETPVLLCVGYVQRSLQDVQFSYTSRETYMANMEFRDRSFWRAYRCGTLVSNLMSVGVQWKDEESNVVFRPYKGKKRLLCYENTPLLTEYGFLVDSSWLVKRVYFDETFERLNERLRVENHEKNAWDFPKTPLDVDAVNAF